MGKKGVPTWDVVALRKEQMSPKDQRGKKQKAGAPEAPPWGLLQGARIPAGKSSSEREAGPLTLTAPNLGLRDDA